MNDGRDLHVHGRRRLHLDVVALRDVVKGRHRVNLLQRRPEKRRLHTSTHVTSCSAGGQAQ